MTAVRPAMNDLKALLYFVIAAALVVSPNYSPLSPIMSMGPRCVLFAASGIIAGICVTNGLAHLRVIQQPSWAWDQIFLPLSGVLALSLLLPL
ncbi:hypothetical protein [Rhizobium sp. BK176]|uniref:hypothetical protein n=1 Tax=Rhizobium sp. BK176 TaxID=2587071 RepID=UPI00216A2659|nr:hypothetical protein [Rhizobium sp. BK176]MCS4089670.1 hypothetical protein [Rhizobium sp. BK176]